MPTITVDIPHRDVSLFKKIISRMGWTCNEEVSVRTAAKPIGDKCAIIRDITEIPNIYNNPNARLIYLHLALKSIRDGDDRGKVAISYRKLAEATGCTASATRHALKVLEDAQLITRDGDNWILSRL